MSPNVENEKSRKKADGTDLKKELVKLKGWVCCNGNASGEGSPD